MSIPTNLPKNDFTKKMVDKYRLIVKKGDFKSIKWDGKEKKFEVTR